MATTSELYVDPGTTDAIPVYLVVVSGVNTYLPRAVLNDSSANEITAGNPLNVLGTVVTVLQGTSPWLVNASIVGIPNVNASIQGVINGIVTVANNAGISTVYQAGAPWLVNSSIQGTLNVNATVFQGTSAWTVTGTVTTSNSVIAAVTNVTLATFATVYQGAAPWTVLASIQGTPVVNANVQGTVPVSGTFWQSNQPVTASIIGAPVVTATVSGGFVAPQADAGAVGALAYRNSSLVATCVTVKTGSTNLYGYHFYNPGSSVAFINLFAQTLATSGLTAQYAQLAIPSGGWADQLSELPITYSPGLLMSASASINGSGNPASSILANVYYK